MTIAVGLGSEYGWYAPTLLSPAGDYGSFGGDLTDNGNYTNVNGTEQAPTGGGGTSVAWFSNGSDSRGMDLGNTFSNNHYSNTTGKTSLSFWMLPEATNSVVAVGSGLYGTPAIEVRLNCGRDSNGDMYASFESGGSVLLNANLGSGTTNMIHVAMVWDDNVRAAIYKNGVLVAEDTTVGTWKSGYLGGALMKSTTSTGLNTGGGGYIDDFRIYRSILSETQITHLATERKVLGAVGLGGEKLWLSPSVGHSNSIAMDMSGTSNNGTYRNGVGTIADTSSGGTLAFDFDGTADRIDFPSTILGGSQVFSMACWVYVDSHDQNDGQGYMGQVELGSPAGSNDVAALYSGGWNTNPYYVSSSWQSITAAGGVYEGTNANGFNYSPPTGSWHHLACVADGSVNTLYVDGVAQNYPSSYTGSFPTPSNSFQIGRYGSSNNGCLDGRMDDARVYHRALTQSEITHLASQRGIEGPPPVGLGDEQLWLCPSLNDSAADISGNGNDGTYNGGMGTIADTSSGGSLAYAIDGSAKYISLPSGIATSSEDSFSLSVWYNRQNNSSNRILFLEGDGVLTASGIFMSFGSGGNAGSCGHGAKPLTVNTPNALYSVGNFHNVCMTSDGGTLKLYVDGVLISTNTTTSPADLSQAGRIGRDGNDTTTVGFFHVDDIRAYNRTLTQAEITHLASQRGVEGPAPVGLGDEQLWLCPSLKDSANDISGYGRNGTYNGGMGTVADTSNGGSRAYDFDGVNDYIDVVSSGVPAAAYSVSLWQNSSRASNLNSTAFNAGDASNNRVAHVNGVKNGASDDSHGHQSSGSSYWVQNTVGRSQNTWYHYLLTYDGNSLRLYVDGNLVNTLASVPNTTYTETKCWIGQYIGSGFHFQGMLDDIRTYGRALTQSEITHLATSRGIEGPAPVGLGDEQLWLCPSLNDSANDISGNGNDGTYSGGMATVLSDGKLAYDFDGTDDYIDIQGLTGQYTIGGSFSTSIWVYQDTVKYQSYFNRYQSEVEVYSFGTTGQRTELLDAFPTNTPTRAGFNSTVTVGAFPPYFTLATNNILSANGTNQSGAWYNLVTTYDSTTKTQILYKNGVNVGSTVYHPDSIEVLSTDYAEVGRVSTLGTSDNYFAGKMDDVRSFTRVLTQSEITHLSASRGIEGSPSTSATVIASTSGQRSGTGQAGAAINTTGADMIIVSVSGYGSVPTVSDSEGNTWVNLSTSGGARKQRLSYCLSPTTSSSHTFFCTGNGQPSMSIVAFSGVGSYESENFSADVAGTTVQAGAVTPTTDNSLVFIGAVNEGGIYNAVDSGFTLETAVVYTAGVAMGDATAYLVQPLAASVNATLTCSAPTGKSASVAVFTTTSTPDVFFNPFKSTTFQNQTFNNGGIGE